MRISDWSSDVCSSDLAPVLGQPQRQRSKPGVKPGWQRAGQPACAHARSRLAQTIGQNVEYGHQLIIPSRLDNNRSEEHTSELQSLMRISYAVFCLKKKKQNTENYRNHTHKTNKNTT